MVIDLIRFVVDDTLTPIYPCSKWLLYCEMLEGGVLAKILMTTKLNNA